MNKTAYEDFKKSEKQMNALYAQILKENKDDTLYVKKFKKSQKLWLKFREADMDYKYPVEKVNKRPSCATMCYMIHKAYLTEQRIKEFKDLIISEEGDICR